MNAAEAEAAVRMVAASWPTPQMTDDETARWVVRFRDVGFDEAAVALLDLEKTHPRRPAWSDVYGRIQDARRRVREETGRQLAIAGTDESYAEIGKRNIAKIRAEWAKMPRMDLRLDADPRVR